MKVMTKDEYTPTKNACKLCSPLGASFVFKGIANCIPLLHGSQGCSTYIRRYLISHFNEPIDIASSNFTEEAAIFGGGVNLKLAIQNITKQYEPECIGIASTCLSETIGDDVDLILKDYKKNNKGKSEPEIVSVSTPSYSGTHIDGFHATVRSLVDSISPMEDRKGKHINIFPGMLSPADFRYLKEILEDFGADYVMLPDYSDTFDGPLWSRYRKIPVGGTSMKDIASIGSACASMEFGRILAEGESAGKLLKARDKIPCFSQGLPIGVKETDLLFDTLELITGRSTPEKHIKERDRLIDSYVDGHKYLFESRAVLYGEEDLIVGLASFLSEIGVIPVVCASGGKSGHIEEKLDEVIPDMRKMGMTILEGVDFMEIGKAVKDLSPDFMIGNSKGYKLARQIKKPLIRVGFPIHDRLGGGRIMHVGYRGAQQLFDTISNTIIALRQDNSSIGYTYM
ncbi:MAG: nitrogenase component 1 [Thermodesulfobacteriota bacterium]|nr:nitrogenase component 1 [Thermodesulfobacteriota bacterium]